MKKITFLIGIVILLFSCEHLHEKRFSLSAPFYQNKKSKVNSIVRSLSLDEKIGQILIAQSNLSDSIEEKTIIQSIKSGKLGGFLIEDIPFKKFISFKDSCHDNAVIPFFCATNAEVTLHSQFSDLENFPSQETINSIRNDSLVDIVVNLYVNQCEALGINFSFISLPNKKTLFNKRDTTEKINEFLSKRIAEKIKQLNNSRILTFSNINLDDLAYFDDTLAFAEQIFHFEQKLFEFGFSGVRMNIKNGITDFMEKFKETVPEYYNKNFDFSGLVTTNFSPGSTNITDEDFINIFNTTDIFIVKSPKTAFRFLKQQIKAGVISKRQLNKKVKKIIFAKLWMNNGINASSEKHSPKEDVAIKNDDNIFAEASLSTVIDIEVPVSIEPNYKNDTTKTLISNDLPVQSKYDIKGNLFNNPRQEFLRYSLYKESIILAKNENIIPFYPYGKFKIFPIGKYPLENFKKYFSKYANCSVENIQPDSMGNFTVFPDRKYWNQKIVFLLDSVTIRHQRLVDFIQDISKNNKVILINFGNVVNLTYFDSLNAVVQIYEKNNITESLAAQLLFGGIYARGRIPREISSHFKTQRIKSIPQIRLSYGLPEEVGIASEKLDELDAIIEKALRNKEFPGCQLLFAKDGNVFFSKNYGYFTYDKKIPVEDKDLYDMASISKIIGTTLATMKLFEKEKFKLSNRIGSHIDCSEELPVGQILINELFIHQSGLQAFTPIADYIGLNKKQVPNWEDFFIFQKNDTLNIQVTDSFYFKKQYLDTIWQRIYHLDVDTRLKYRYSDVNFLLLQKLVESKSGLNLDEYLYKNFYNPLGLRRVTYQPLKKFSLNEIVPTEFDKRWRQKLVHGYPHDETAAIFGGVAGNAGIFANADDLAIILQMWLNRGNYGGKHFLNKKTIDFYSSANHGNHRGLGFDKPSEKSKPSYAEDAPSSSYGHTGYTGTTFWVDPENNIIFILLTNRVHPTRKNRKLYENETRRKLHQVIYDALGSFEGI